MFKYISDAPMYPLAMVSLSDVTKALNESQPENDVHSGGARGVMVIVAGCGLGDTSSNPGRD